MRIPSFNSAISSVAKSARNTVAAAMVAASPMVAKAEKAVDPNPRAVTNTVETIVGRYNIGDDGSYEPILYGMPRRLKNCPTNDLPTFVEITKMTPKSSTDSSSYMIEAVANGWVPAGEIRYKINLGNATEEWKPVVAFANKAKAENTDYVPPIGASRFEVEVPEIEGCSNAFYKVVVPGIKDGKLVDDMVDLDKNIYTMEFVDVAGKTVKPVK